MIHIKNRRPNWLHEIKWAIKESVRGKECLPVQLRCAAVAELQNGSSLFWWQFVLQNKGCRYFLFQFYKWQKVLNFSLVFLKAADLKDCEWICCLWYLYPVYVMDVNSHMDGSSRYTSVISGNNIKQALLTAASCKEHFGSRWVSCHYKESLLLFCYPC